MNTARALAGLLRADLGAMFTVLVFGSSPAIAAIDLNNYELNGTYFLPRISASEASAVTYNWDSGTLFVLGDEGDALVEVSVTGTQVSVMTLTGFDDTEGVTYVGSGKFIVTEERLREAYEVSYMAGGSVARTALPSADLGSTVGNVGIEGISYDPRDGTFITVKENSPQEINLNTITFGTPGSAVISELLDATQIGALNLVDLSDVQSLATVPSLLGTSEADNFLLFSQESAALLELDRSGTVLSTFSFSGLADQAEGVTIDPAGNIYIVDENGDDPRLFVLKPVPIPAAFWLFGSALAGLLWRQKR